MQIKTLSLLLLGACAGISEPSDHDLDPAVAEPGTSPPAWKAIALPSAGRVTGLLFGSPDRGFAATDGNGAVFAVDGSTASFALSRGIGAAPADLAFTGLVQTPAGIVATADASMAVRSDAWGQFSIQRNGNLDERDAVIGYEESETGAVLVRSSGIISRSPQPAGMHAEFEDIWNPAANEDLPGDMCQLGPSNGAYIGNHMIAYGANEAWSPEICISADGGRSFYPHVLDVPDGAIGVAPAGVTFASPTLGLAWRGTLNGSSYIMRTTDAGENWTRTRLPAALAKHALAFDAGLFAADGSTAWVIGYDLDSHAALGLVSRDGGESWSEVLGLGDVELTSGFALDATHVWFGRADGVVLAHD